ncbi:MAG: hypothetical protein WA144_08940 [Candidatus Methanoperedens sp.]
MEEKCPKCGETLLTRTITKKIGLGSIDYPIAQTCPKCNWNKDLTGASDVVAKPVMQDAGETKKEEKKAQIIPPIKSSASSAPSSKSAASPSSINSLIMILLAILVVGAIAWVFFNPADDKQAVNTPAATPIITGTPVLTPATTIGPEVTASGKQISVKLDTKRGITPKSVPIKPGDEVVWTNDGTYAVTLVSSDGLFEEKFLNNGKRTNYIFKTPGTFSFYLKEDKNMSGTIIVER